MQRHATTLLDRLWFTSKLDNDANRQILFLSPRHFTLLLLVTLLKQTIPWSLIWQTSCQMWFHSKKSTYRQTSNIPTDWNFSFCLWMSNIQILASCPWGPATAHGVSLLTEMCAMCASRNLSWQMDLRPICSFSRNTPKSLCKRTIEALVCGYRQATASLLVTLNQVYLAAIKFNFRFDIMPNLVDLQYFNFYIPYVMNSDSS